MRIGVTCGVWQGSQLLSCVAGEPLDLILELLKGVGLSNGVGLVFRGLSSSGVLILGRPDASQELEEGECTIREFFCRGC